VRRELLLEKSAVTVTLLTRAAHGDSPERYLADMQDEAPDAARVLLSKPLVPQTARERTRYDDDDDVMSPVLKSATIQRECILWTCDCVTLDVCSGCDATASCARAAAHGHCGSARRDADDYRVADRGRPLASWTAEFAAVAASTLIYCACVMLCVMVVISRHRRWLAAGTK
jgi:hypothetical protein